MSIKNADYSTINFDEMAASIGLKAKHIPMLIGSFVGEAAEILSALQMAISHNDYKGIQRSAHSIKGSAGNLKFNEVYAMAKEMELNAEKENSNFEYKLYFDAMKAAIATIPN